MDRADELVALFDGLEDLSPAGYAIGLHLSFTTSKYIFQTYRREWMEEYSQKGLILYDPTVRWGLSNTGWIRWSDLVGSDPGGVIAAASQFGLHYGVSVSVAEGDARSLGSFASGTANFDETVIEDLARRLLRMHQVTTDIEPESADDKKIKRFAASVSRTALHSL